MPRLRRDLDQLPTAGHPLTRRELQVLRHLADGLEYAEIGQAMHLSASTVKFHCSALRAKLGARNAAHAVAIGYGLLAADPTAAANA